MTTWDFACSDPIDISVDNWTAGSIVISGEPTSSLVVEVVPSHRHAELIDQVQVAFEDGQLYVQGPRVGARRRWQGLDLTIKAPAGSTCAARTVSSDLSCVGDISAVSLQTASGDLTVASVGDVAMRSASGDALLNRVSGSVTVHTASGNVEAIRVDGDVKIDTASGDVAIGYCGGPVTVRTASGDVKLSAVGTGRVELASTSGDLAVAVMPGLGVYLDLVTLSGDIRSELDARDGADSDGPDPDSGAEPQAALRVSCRTTSGNIKITKSRVVPSEPAAV